MVVIQRIEAFCGISYIVILVPSFSNLCSHLTDIQFFFYHVKIRCFISHEGDIPTSEASYSTDPPPSGMCTVICFFFFWLLCFLPEESNKNKLTVTKVSFISEWITSFLSSAPLFGFVVSIFSKWLMHCSKPFATSWDLSLVFRVRYIWRFIRVMHKRETLKCKRCFQLSKTLKNSFAVFNWKPFFMTKTMILTSRTKILSKHFRFESLNGIPQRVSSHLYIFSSKNVATISTNSNSIVTPNFPIFLRKSGRH